ncbi:hypothetical protein BK126_15390 [Paenibacillus sp. FSL H7-0326]|uniref:rolling circle replication-associated protein n=1 Tax=Paenibacillus sp. FSL H7-0326 TaxID=1921144 RepID=UPI00096FE4F4|nr:hypothetical protein [Paenibacillus sp. FSL H7-0326]OMC69148.1 hypothetical protein BK126_15390 [Paenibacillus sp. FSL H7-0326]
MNKRIERIQGTSISESQMVTVKTMRDYVEVTAVDKANRGLSKNKKLSKDEYVNTETGEIHQYKNTNVGTGKSIESARKSTNMINDLIHNNFQAKKNEWFATLTYRENMKCTKQLYEDFEKFWKRLKYEYGKNIDYISIAEPHEDGSWHLHVLIRFNDKEEIAIKPSDINDLWGKGYVSLKEIYDVPGLAGYLSKGKRLKHYPPGMKMYRSSRGIKKPKKEKVPYGQLKERIEDATLDSSYTDNIYDKNTNRLMNTISKEKYNMKQKLGIVGS